MTSHDIALAIKFLDSSFAVRLRSHSVTFGISRRTSAAVDEAIVVQRVFDSCCPMLILVGRLVVKPLARELSMPSSSYGVECLEAVVTQFNSAAASLVSSRVAQVA